MKEPLTIGESLYDLTRLGEPEQAVFLSRPNRFIAVIRTKEGEEARCHVADTGRLREILTPGRPLLVTKNRPGMKTAYRLIAAKMEAWSLINTSIHSAITRTAISRGVLGTVPETVKAEVAYGKSRLDFCVEGKLWIEQKSSNLLIGSHCRFPDAPTTRGKRHVEELIRLVKEGQEAMILIMGTRQCHCFWPSETDPDFAQVFQEALEAGVRFHGFKVTVDEAANAITYQGLLPLCPKEERGAFSGWEPS